MTPLTPAAVTALAQQAAESPAHLDPVLVQQVCQEWETMRERLYWFEKAGGVAMATRVHTIMNERDAARAERDALMVRVDQWRQMADREATAYVEMRAERDAALAERDDARAALQAVEWADMERRCPWCLAYADDNIGHKAYCQRQAALGVGTGEG